MYSSVFLFLLTINLAAADWPQYRGLKGLGLSNDKNLPVEVGRDTNVVWKTELPPGHSSPILVGSRIFLTAYQGDDLSTICLDRASGKILWKRQTPRPRKEGMQKTNSPASPTPVSDGKSVYVFFGDYGLLAYGVDGEDKWNLPLGPFNNQNGHGSSPALFDDTLVLICDQDTGSYVIALNKDTGKVAWRVERPEVTRGYATPGLYEPKGGRKQVVIPGAYQLAAYDLRNGEKIWWVNGMAWQLKCVPIIDGETIYINAWETGGDFDKPPVVLSWEEMLAKYDRDNDKKITKDEAPQELQRWYGDNDLDKNGAIDERDWQFWILHRTAQNSMSAVRPGTRRGDLTKEVLWRYHKSLPNVPSPLLYQDTLFLVKDGGVLTTLNPKTGEVQKQARVPAIEQYWASPVGGDGKVYVLSSSCKLTALKAAAQWEVLHMSDLEDECFATPALADGGIYLRTRRQLYFFKNKQ
ncbi:MAG: PQQ-binding-like beta-propeller repeat protein [Candidatus Solibacter usitatus]|nr:PQQ-binding-like beta-propeller repeat protein [Candidatus Solibacter usitatus]